VGARSNIVVQDGEDRVWLYGHWMSCQAVEHAANGLRSGRFDDPQYLASVIFQSMLDSEGAEGHGYGISARRYDNQFPILVIDSRSRWRTGSDRGTANVWFEDEDGLVQTPVFSRDEFLAIADTIPLFRPAWDRPGEHDCAYGHFFDRPRPVRLTLPAGSDQISDI
jgi:hypothetical protein